MDYQKIYNNIDDAYGCRIAKELSLIGNEGSILGFKNAGSTGEKKAAAYIYDEMKKIGINNVTVDSFEVDSWEFKDSMLVYKKDGKRISYPLSAFAGIRGTGKKPIKAQIVNAGYGTYEDCKRINLKDKIAFIKVDLSKEYWLGVPVHQLEARGALAVVVMFTGTEYGDCEEALNSGDSIARPNIPIVNISRKNGKKLISDIGISTINIELYVNCVLGKGESQNIIGEIPGEKHNEYIMIGGHYDGYFRAYIDDAFAIGIMLTLAKAIKESNEKPKYTIKFIAHGAEEFGICNSHCDWCIGSWQQITNLTPQWGECIKLFLNIDAVSPDAKEFLIQASPQLHEFIGKSLGGITKDILEYWPAGFIIDDVNGPWSDDFNYYMAGIPVAICGRGASEWRKKYYHTDFDDCTNLNKELLKKMVRVYTKLICDFNTGNSFSVKFSNELKFFRDSIDGEILADEKLETKKLKHTIQKLEKVLDVSYHIKSLCYPEVNRMLTREIRRLNFNDELKYRFSEIQKNIEILNEVEGYISGGNYEAARRSILDFSGGDIIKDFEDKIYEYWCIEAIDEEKTDLKWANGLMEQPIDVRRLFRLIYSGGGKQDIINEIKYLKTGEVSKAEIYINRLQNLISDIIEKTGGSIGDSILES